MKLRFGYAMLAAFLVAGTAAWGATEDAVPSPAPDPAAASAPVTDPAQVAAHFREVVARPEFQETDEPDANARLRGWLSEWFSRLGTEFGKFEYAREMPRVASLLMTLLVVLSIGGILYTLMRLTRRPAEWRDPVMLDPRGEKTLRAPEFYERELREARSAGDWHAAWLASWRQFLSRLEKGHLVEADRSRTNREYLTQLSAKPLPTTAFALLARMVDAYDNFIYGRRAIGEAEWSSFHQQVNEATLLLHLDEAGPGDGGATKAV
jgi:hypothetical protein